MKIMVLQEPRKRFTIVIPTKNGGDLFVRVLQGLQKQTAWQEAQLIVIDSGSQDDTVANARGAGAKVFEISPSEFNHGATRDFGISESETELVVLMVQDAVPNDENLLTALLKPFEIDAMAGVYARQIPQPSADVLTKRNLNNWQTGRMESEVRQMSSLEWYEARSPMDKYLFCNFDNVCSAIRKSVWVSHKMGPINFGEDIDWAERALKTGYKIAYEPQAAVIHSHDRPMLYEYKRTYVCHRKLYQQFALHLVPSRKGIFRSWLYCTVKDFQYVRAQPVAVMEKIALYLKIPTLNFLSALAQFKAVHDERKGMQNKITGV